MAVNERDMRAEMSREITVPGEAAIPLIYPTHWQGQPIASKKDITQMANTSPTDSSLGSSADVLSGILKQVTSMLEMPDHAAQLTGLLQDRKAIQQNQIQSAQEISSTKLALSQQVGMAALDAQDAGIAVRNKLENNPNDPDSLLSILTQDFVENTKAAREQRNAIAEKKQVGLFDNPLDFLWNQITLPDEINAMKATQSKADAAKQGISEMQALTTTAAQAQLATAKNLTKESLRQKYQVDAANLQDQIQKLKFDSIGTDMEALKALEAADAQKLNHRIQLLSALNQASHLALSQQAGVRADYDYTKQVLDDKEIDEQAAKAAVGAKQAGIPGMTAAQIRFGIKNRQIEPGMLRELTARGERYLAQEAAGVPPSPALGNTPGLATLSLMRTGGLNEPQNQPVKDYMDKLWDEAKAELSARPGFKPDAPSAQQDIAELVDKKLNGVGAKGEKKWELSKYYKEWSNMETSGNIWGVADARLKDFAQLPALQNNIMYKTVIAPAIASGADSLKHSAIEAHVIAAMNRGELTPEQAYVGMKDLYSATKDAKYLNSGMRYFGLQNSGKYIVNVQSQYNPFAKDQVDLLGPANLDRLRNIYRDIQEHPENFGVTR